MRFARVKSGLGQVSSRPRAENRQLGRNPFRSSFGAARFEGAYEILDQLNTKDRLWRLRANAQSVLLIDIVFSRPTIEPVAELLAAHLGDRLTTELPNQALQRDALHEPIAGTDQTD